MQPTYLPWIGYFALMDQVDTFVLLDDVQFSPRSWQQRNRIKSAQGLQWLTVPVHASKGQPINEVQVADRRSLSKHLRAIEQHYRKAAFFRDYYPSLSRVFAGLLDHEPLKLCNVNTALIDWLATQLGITTERIAASTIESMGARGHRLASLCTALGAHEYLSPMGSADYLKQDQAAFAAADIRIQFQNYSHPVYQQLYGPFAAHATTLDLLFNLGPKALATLRSGTNHPHGMHKVFATRAPSDVVHAL